MPTNSGTSEGTPVRHPPSPPALQETQYNQAIGLSWLFAAAMVGGQMRSAAAVSIEFQTIIDGWLANKNPIRENQTRLVRILNRLLEFPGHDDVRRIQVDDQVAWMAAHAANDMPASCLAFRNIKSRLWPSSLSKKMWLTSENR